MTPPGERRVASEPQEDDAERYGGATGAISAYVCYTFRRQSFTVIYADAVFHLIRPAMLLIVILYDAYPPPLRPILLPRRLCCQHDIALSPATLMASPSPPPLCVYHALDAMLSFDDIMLRADDAQHAFLRESVICYATLMI